MMRIREAGLVAMLLLLASSALAGTSPPGVNLRWDQCFGDAGAQYRNFACDTNSGSERMVGSFELASDLPIPASGLEISMDFAFVGTAVPLWWQFKNVGSCRQTSLSHSTALPPGATNCVDWAAGLAAGGVSAYTLGAHGPNTVRTGVAFAVPLDAQASLFAGQEYFAFALVINHAKTVGTGACAGCLVPGVMFLTSIKVVTQVAANDILLNQAANWSGSQWVSWQMGYPTNIFHGCGVSFPPGFCGLPYTTFTVTPYDPTPTRPSTWGQVKSLYR